MTQDGASASPLCDAIVYSWNWASDIKYDQLESIFFPSDLLIDNIGIQELFSN